MAKPNNFRIWDVRQWPAVLIFEPFMKSLDGKTRCSELNSDRLGCEAFVEETDEQHAKLKR